MTPEPTNPKPETPNPEQFLSSGRFALVLAVLLAATFWRVLFGGEAFFYRDYGFLGYPFAHFHRECFWSGDFFPLWNPYVNCGAPFLAQWNTLCLYPGALIYLLLPLPWSLGFFCVAHLFLGGMGMRALAERWTGSRFGAAVAGVAFVFSGLVLGCVIYPNYLVALGWMPWVVLAARRAWQEGGRNIVLAALAGAMQMLTGAPEIILLTWGFLAALAVMDVGVRRKTENVSRGLLTHYALRFTSIPLLITGLCAAQLLPFFQLLSLSQRSGDAVNTFWSLPGWGWVNLFFPLFMNFQTEQGVFVMIGQAFFPSVYLGIVPLTLALLAVWRIGLRRAVEPAVVGRGVLTPPPDTRTPQDLGGAPGTARPTSPEPTAVVWEVRLLAGATLLAVLLAMGDNFVLWRWLREVLPLGVMRFPVKALLLAAFTVPLLAAWGVSTLWNVQRPATWFARHQLELFVNTLILGVLFYHSFPALLSHPSLIQDAAGIAAVSAGMRLAILLLFASWVALRASDKRLGRHSVLLALLLLWGDAVFHQPILNPTIPGSAFEPGLASAYHASKNALTPAPKLGESRIMLSPLAERALHTRMVPKFYDDFIGQRLAFWGNLNLLDGLPKVNGASTLVTREWNDVEYFLYGTTNPAPANLMDFLGVTHTTKPGELMQWERRTNAMPLVSAGQETEMLSERRVSALANSRWNPAETVLLVYEPGHSPPSRKAAAARVLATRMKPASVAIEVEAATESVVVVAQTYYPKWRATVNGQPMAIFRANHAFQAIPIPAGRSTIRLDYVDWPFRIGAGISLLALLGCAQLWRRGANLK